MRKAIEPSPDKGQPPGIPHAAGTADLCHGDPVIHYRVASREGNGMGVQKDRMLAGEPYIPDAELDADFVRAAGLIARFNAFPATDSAGQRAVLAELLGEVGDDTLVRPPLRVDFGYQISIGPRTFINYGAVLADNGKITIGADTQIGPNVQLLTATHPIDPERRRARWEQARPITIGDNVWIGGGAVICPGVSIGLDTVVGAGAVVIRDLPAGVVAVGNPARVIRQI